MTTPSTNSYQKNIQWTYAFSFFKMFLVIIPVIVPYFLKLGFSMEEVFQQQALFSLSMAVFEVPSGYLSDLWGRKKTMMLGSFITAVSFTWLVFAQTFWEIALHEIMAGLGISLISGADLSILYDSLDFVDQERETRTKVVANYQFCTVSSEAIASIVGGLLVKISFQAVLVAHAITYWIPFLICFKIKEPPIKRMDRTQHLKNYKMIFKHLFKTNRLITLVFVNQVLWGLSTFFAVWIFQKYWQESSVPLYAFGLLWASYNFTVGIAGKLVPKIEREFGPLVILFMIGVLPPLGYWGMSYTIGWIGVLLGFCFQITRGFNMVILRDALNWRTESSMRATVNSMSSLLFRLSFAFLGPAVGYIIDRYGLSFSLRSLGTVYFALFLLVMLPLISEVKKLNIKRIPS